MQRQQSDKGQKSFQYRLYGVVVHSGSLQGGHYTACVRSIDTARIFLQKTFLDRQMMMNKEELIKLVAEGLPRERLDTGQWFMISDSTVHEIHRDQVFQKEAYLLFYERLS